MIMDTCLSYVLDKFSLRDHVCSLIALIGGDDGADLFILKPNASAGSIFSYTPSTSGLKFSIATSAFPVDAQDLDLNWFMQ